MNNKLHKRLILVFVALFICSVIGLSATTARYVSAPPSSNDDLSGDLQYTVENQVEISSAEQFFTAIANGYSNIKLSDDVQNPLLISGSGMNVWSDLTLDLNGHDIQRNSREPMLTVVPGVKMTVVDSSSQQNGSFYNPVGSVLAIDGGALTVMSGKFESGVRPSEYYSAHNATSYTGGLVDTGGNKNKYDVDNGSATTKVFAPTLLPTVMVSGTDDKGNNKYIVNGNVYFDSAYQSNSDLIPADTYLYLVMEGASDTMVATGSADFHYSYTLYTNVVSSDFIGEPEYYLSENSIPSGTDYKALNVTIYGYRNVMSYAKNDTSAISNGSDTSGNMQNYLGREKSNFAAIKMRLGNLYSRGGDYTSHFGVDTAYCIYAAGGDMIVSGGNFATNKEGVCIQCAFGDGALDGSLTVSDGIFSSEKGNTIQVKSGQMTVTGGTFVKDASADIYSTASTAKGENGASIYVQSGQLDINGESEVNPISFELYGSGVCGIAMASVTTSVGDSSLNINNATFICNEANENPITTKNDFHDNAGIYNMGGTIMASNCLFNIPDDNSIGIDLPASDGAKVDDDLTQVTGSLFVMPGEKAIGIKIQSGSLRVGDPQGNQDSACAFYIDNVIDCYGIYTERKEGKYIDLEVSAAQFIMGQDDTAIAESKDTNNLPPAYSDTASTTASLFHGSGIRLDIGDSAKDSFTIQRALFFLGGSYTAGIHAVHGSLLQEGSDSNYRLVLGIGFRHNNYGGAGTVKNASGDADYKITKFGKDWFYMTTPSKSYVAAERNMLFSDAQSVQGKNHFTANDVLPTVRFSSTVSTNAIGSYGIFSGGGEVVSRNLYVNNASTFGSAVYAQNNATVSIGNFQCDIVTNGNASTTATTYSGGNVVSFTADVSAHAIYVLSGNVNIQNSIVNTDSNGYYVSNGNITFGPIKNSDGAYRWTDLGHENHLRSVRGAPIVVNTGTFTVQDESVDSNTQTKFSLLANIASKASITDNTSYSASQDLTGRDATAIQPHGIYVTAGNFISRGTLNIDFTGLPSDISSKVANLISFKTRSYAVYVQGDATHDTTVSIDKSDIISYVGGGVYVSSVNASKLAQVALGVADATDSVQVTTLDKGDEFNDGTTWSGNNESCTSSKVGTYYSAVTGNYDSRTITKADWMFRYNAFGGDAVTVHNGHVVINNGSYISYMGNGVMVDGASSDVTISNGVFRGTDAYGIDVQPDTWGISTEISNAVVGPGASCGLKLIEGTLVVNNGEFTGAEITTDNYSGNGALVMGSTGPDSNGNYACTAKFNGGKYLSDDGRGLQIIGYCQVDIGDSTKVTDTVPYMQGNVYAIGVEAFNDDTYYDLLVNLYQGEFYRIGTVPWNGCYAWYIAGNHTGSVNVSGVNGATSVNLYTSATSTNPTSLSTGTMNNLYGNFQRDYTKVTQNSN